MQMSWKISVNARNIFDCAIVTNFCAKCPDSPNVGVAIAANMNFLVS